MNETARDVEAIFYLGLLELCRKRRKRHRNVVNFSVRDSTVQSDPAVEDFA